MSSIPGGVSISLMVDRTRVDAVLAELRQGVTVPTRFTVEGQPSAPGGAAATPTTFGQVATGQPSAPASAGASPVAAALRQPIPVQIDLTQARQQVQQLGNELRQALSSAAVPSAVRQGATSSTSLAEELLRAQEAAIPAATAYAVRRAQQTGAGVPSVGQLRRRFPDLLPEGAADVRDESQAQVREQRAATRQKYRQDTQDFRQFVAEKREAERQAKRGAREEEKAEGQEPVERGGRHLPNLLSARGFERLIPGAAGATAGFAVYEAVRVASHVAAAAEEASHPERILRQFDRVGSTFSALADPALRSQARGLAESRFGENLLGAFEGIPILGQALSVGTSIAGVHGRFQDEQYQLNRNIETRQFLQQTGLSQGVRGLELSGDRLGAIRAKLAIEEAPLQREAAQVPELQHKARQALIAEYDRIAANPGGSEAGRTGLPTTIEQVDPKIAGQLANAKDAVTKLAVMRRQNAEELAIYTKARDYTTGASYARGDESRLGVQLDSRGALDAGQRAARLSLRAQLTEQKADNETWAASFAELNERQAADRIRYGRQVQASRTELLGSAQQAILQGQNNPFGAQLAGIRTQTQVALDQNEDATAIPFILARGAAQVYAAVGEQVRGAAGRALSARKQQNVLRAQLNRDPLGAEVEGIRGQAAEDRQRANELPWGLRQIAQFSIDVTAGMRERYAKQQNADRRQELLFGLREQNVGLELAVRPPGGNLVLGGLLGRTQGVFGGAVGGAFGAFQQDRAHPEIAQEILRGGTLGLQAERASFIRNLQPHEVDITRSPLQGVGQGDPVQQYLKDIAEKIAQLEGMRENLGKLVDYVSKVTSG
jgi:hypothetical protein